MAGECKVVVVGAGIIGASSALALVEAGFQRVYLVASEWTPKTTSDVAGALWTPHGVDASDHRVQLWGQQTLEHLLELRRRHGSERTGITLSSGYRLFRRIVPDPHWKDQVFGFRHVKVEELRMIGMPEHYVHGWFFTSVIVEMPTLMDFILDEFYRMGGRCVRLEQPLKSLREALTVIQDDLGAAGPEVIVNCTGVYARDLVGDDSVYPVRGQVVRVRAPYLRHFFLEVPVEDEVPSAPSSDAQFFYIMPRSRDVVLGGIAQPNRWTREIDPADSAAVMSRVTECLPELLSAPVLGEGVGLRPCRAQLRLERESDAPIVHNYGHAGSGMTLHWGCALEVVKLVKEAAQAPKKRARL